MNHRKIGDEGESIALEYLISLGYQPIFRNFCCRGGEVDIICKDTDTIVFVRKIKKYLNLELVKIVFA